jgi:hypothetical protein
VWGLNATNLIAACKLKITPGDAEYEVQCFPGELTEEEGFIEQVVEEAITFNNAGSLNLQYQPDTQNIEIQALSQFYDAFGRVIAPNFASYGDTINEVEWISSTSYRGATERKVRRDEIVAVTALGNMIPVTGAIQVSYVIKSKKYNLRFRATVSPQGNIDGWDTAYVLSHYGNETGFLRIEPPSLKET